MPMTIFGSQVALAWIAAHLIEWIKKSPLPFAKYGSFWLNALTSSVAALIAAGAFTYTFAADGTFSMAGNIYSILEVLWNAVIQYSLQHLFFKATISPPPTPTLTKTDIKDREHEK